jgi:uncharacterized repeat protein (TIGR03847 family)
MDSLNYQLASVTRITAGAIGKPGHRTFFIQGERGSERITLLCEKEQIAALAVALEELLATLERERELPASVITGADADMAIAEPADPLFRAGALGIGYDPGSDRVLLVADEALEEDETREPRQVRLLATRTQMRRMAAHAREVVAQGRSPQQRALQQAAESRRNGHGE